MSAKATTEETSRPGLTAVVSTSETSQATEAKSVGTKHQQTNSFETTPTHQDSKENTSSNPDSGQWEPESTPSRQPHLHRRKVLEFATPDPSLQMKPNVVEQLPTLEYFPAAKQLPALEYFPAAKQLTERQQMSLLLQLTSTPNQTRAASHASSRKATVNWRVHKRNERGETPLHVASKKGDLAAVNQLIRQGAEINSRDHAGWTPLHEAAIHGHPDIVAKLLKKGADPNALGMDNDSPLHDAAGNSHTQVVQILLENGATPDQKNSRGELPIDLTIDHSLIEMIRQHSDSWSSEISSDSQEMSKETDTTDSLEKAFQTLDESLELDTKIQEGQQWNIGLLSPQLSPIKSEDNDQQTSFNSLASEETCLVVNNQGCDSDVDPATLLLALENCTEFASEQPPSDSHQLDSSESFSPQTDATSSDQRTTSTDLSSSEDQPTTDLSSITSKSETTHEPGSDTVSSNTQTADDNDQEPLAELGNKEQPRFPMARKRLLYSQKYRDHKPEASFVVQPKKQKISFVLPPGFEQTLTYTKNYTIQTEAPQDPEKYFFESLFPPKDTVERLRLKHKVEKEKLMITFEQQVLYAADQCHPGPKPVTFCGFLAITQGWHLVQQTLEGNENTKATFDMEKYTDLLTSIRENYDKAATQLASRQQLELDTVWACSSQRTAIASPHRPMASKEPFTMA